MQWVIDNWVLVLLGGGMVAFHLFGHGHGHGRKGGQKGADDAPGDQADGGQPDRTTRMGDDRNG